MKTTKNPSLPHIYSMVLHLQVQPVSLDQTMKTTKNPSLPHIYSMVLNLHVYISLTCLPHSLTSTAMVLNLHVYISLTCLPHSLTSTAMVLHLQVHISLTCLPGTDNENNKNPSLPHIYSIVLHLQVSPVSLDQTMTTLSLPTLISSPFSVFI